MTRILVTGATGMVGSTLCPILRQRGHHVIGHGLSAAADVSHDLTDRYSASLMLENIRPEAIINLVALTNVDTCQTDPNLAYQLNTRVVENLTDWVAQNPFVHFVQVSTDQVYDGPGLHDEDDTRLTNCYALTKYAGELAATRLPSTVLRTNLFGRSRVAKRKSLSDWIIENLIKRQAIKVFTDVEFNPLRIATLSRLIELAVERRQAGIFNVGSHDGMSKADFAFEIARVFGLNSDRMLRDFSTSMPFAAHRPKNMRMDCRRFEASFGVRLPTLIEEIAALRGEYDSAA